MSAQSVLMVVSRSALIQMVPTIVSAKLAMSLNETSIHAKVNGTVSY